MVVLAWLLARRGKSLDFRGGCVAGKSDGVNLFAVKSGGAGAESYNLVRMVQLPESAGKLGSMVR